MILVGTSSLLHKTGREGFNIDKYNINYMIAKNLRWGGEGQHAGTPWLMKREKKVIFPQWINPSPPPSLSGLSTKKEPFLRLLLVVFQDCHKKNYELFHDYILFPLPFAGIKRPCRMFITIPRNYQVSFFVWLNPDPTVQLHIHVIQQEEKEEVKQEQLKYLKKTKIASKTILDKTSKEKT